MKKVFFILVIITLSFLSSCKKFLDEPPTTSLAYPTSVANCQALLDNSEVMNQGLTPNYPESSADDYFVTQSQFNSATRTSQLVYIWNEVGDNTSLQNDWAYAYKPIYHANVCLESIEKIDKTNNLLAWNNVKGSAFFFRAFYFLQLVWEYGKTYDEVTSSNDLGIALKITSDLYDPTTRSSVRQSYDRILNDAKQSIQFLPDTTSNPLRPSKVAAYGLLARTYLSMRLYDSAGKYADQYLSSKNSLIDYNGDADIVNSFSLDISPFRLFNKETAFYTSMAPLISFPGITSSYVDSLLYSSYVTDDLRKQAYFTGTGPYKAFKGTYTQDIYTKFSGIATDEMFLIRAECFARKGDKGNAMSDLNTLLIKRWKAGTFVPLTAANADHALQIILLERRKQLLTRGLRWPDLKRLNKESAFTTTLTRIVNGQTYTLLPNDNRYALAIPSIIIQQSGIPQNPR